jgi:hypothetical protein
MAGQVKAAPTFALTPSSERTPTAQNYLTNADFNWLNQYLPDTYEKEFERYGNRTISSFLRMVGAEMPTNSDLIKWAEQGRLHTKYTQVGYTNAALPRNQVIFQVNDVLDPAAAAQVIRVGQTIVVVQNDGSGSNKAVVSAVNNAGGARGQFTADFYEAAGITSLGTGFGNADVTVFIYGSEFRKGTAGMQGSLEANDFIFDNKPIIIKDTYNVSGSDMAQIGWIEITTEDGANGYLWYLKSEHETRLRFDDFLETAMIEAVPAEQGSGADTILGGANAGAGETGAGSDGIFYSVQQRGNIWDGGNPQVLADFDNVISRLDKQGAIEENVLFVDRQFAFDIDDMLAAQNSYGAGGTSYGLFDNDEEMALNLGFSGFRRGYDFYKTDWKYLNDPTMRGGLPSGAGSGRVNGLLVPAGSTSVYDQILGKNAKRPFLHVRYRASETEDRRYKTWITGSAGGAATSDVDNMQVNFLSERAVCTLGANNFFIFQE